MAERQINYDRGVVKRIHPGSGMEVYMYKDNPGVYLNAYAMEVGEEVAKVAGFNTERLGKERIRKVKIAQAMGAIEEEMSIGETIRNVIKTKGDFHVVDIGLGRHHVEDSDNNVLTTTPIPKEQALLLLDQLVKPEVKNAKAEKSPEKKE